MKLYLTLSGSFHRTPINQSKPEPVTLAAWMQSYLAVATQVRQRSPQVLRQQFGLDFLSEPILSQLLQQADQTQEAEKLYQIPALQLLQPTLYHYEFISFEAQIELQPDDPQIPSFWQLGETSQTGVYEIILERRYPGLPYRLDSLWQELQQVWQNYSPIKQIELALQSPDTAHFSFHLPDRPEVKVSVDNTELPVDVREAIAYLRQPQANLSISTAAQTLIQDYQDYSLPPIPQDLKIELSIHPHHQFIIGKGNRTAIENLINQAQQFLFVSSYIIEDEAIAQLICQKAATLPQKVWILTDLRDEVVDRIDTQVETKASLPQYQRADERKVKCLTMLLDAGARLRGGLFHLKTYISEKAAYLGSCNLTRGSLDFNLEAGLICQGTSSHQELLQYFTYFWQYRARYDVLPCTTEGQFIQRTLNISSVSSRFSSQTILTPSQYRNDLQHELSQFRGKVEIYTRGFSPDAEILSLLQSHSTRVYFERFTQFKDYRLIQRFLPGLHAKVTLLGDRVAYIGGVNFQFNPPGFDLIDLMYKTSDHQEISLIRQQLSASS